MAKDNTIFWVIGIILIGILIFYSSDIIKKEADDFVTIKLYDKNKNLIESDIYAIVGGVPNVEFMELIISITNTGDTELNCNVDGFGVAEFNTPQIIAAGAALSPFDSTSWNTGLIAIDDLKGYSQPISVTAGVSCVYDTGTDKGYQKLSKTQDISFSIQEPDFDFTLNTGFA